MSGLIERIGQIAVIAQDVPRATAFYRDTLGLKFLFEAPGLAFFDCGGVRLMLSKPEGEGTANHTSIIYYKVEDIRAAHRVLEERGAEFVSPPHPVAKLPDHELWLAVLKDTEGNLLSLMSEVR
jgi:methylmalonyl-CoA/ethylmalonyl-CoA epimerase